MVYVCTRRGEAIERGIGKKNKVRFGFVVMSGQVCGWHGVAWRVMFVRAFLVLVLELGSWIVGVRGMSGPEVELSGTYPIDPLMTPPPALSSQTSSQG